MSIAEKLTTIAENEPKVFNAGCHALENMITNGFSRKNYCGAFLQSDLTGYEFSQTIYPISGIERMFNSYAGTELPKGIDCSKLECDKSATYYRFAFEWASKLKKIPDIKIPAIPYYTNTYSNCVLLEEIEVIRCSKETVFNNPFSNCPKLTTFRIEGEIGTDFDCSQNPISPQTMNNVLEHLYDYTGTASQNKYKVLFSTECWVAFDAAYPNYRGLSGEDYAVSKGWLIK